MGVSLLSLERQQRHSHGERDRGRCSALGAAWYRVAAGRTGRYSGSMQTAAHREMMPR
jgi:hypothetical protein